MTRTSWPRAPRPRARASTETVTPDTYGRYDSVVSAIRIGQVAGITAALEGAAEAGEWWAILDSNQ